MPPVSSADYSYDVTPIKLDSYNLTHQFDGHDGLVVVGELVVEGHNDAVGHDGEDDDPLEGRPVNQPGHQPGNTED